MNVEVSIASNQEIIRKSDKIVLAGVEHFKKAISNLEKLDLISVLNNEVIEKSKPILEMCLGMHLIGEKNEEGPVE